MHDIEICLKCTNLFLMAGGDPFTRPPLHVKSTYRIRLKSALLCRPGGQGQGLARRNSQASAKQTLKKVQNQNVQTVVTIDVRTIQNLEAAQWFSLFHPLVKAFFFSLKKKQILFFIIVYFCVKQTGKEEECGLCYLLPTVASSSLPLSGLFFVIQLHALHTAKQRGRGFCCYFQNLSLQPQPVQPETAPTLLLNRLLC